MSQLIGIQHEKKHGKGSKNSSIYFDNKMIEEEEMEKQRSNYMITDMMNVPMLKMTMIYVLKHF